MDVRSTTPRRFAGGLVVAAATGAGLTSLPGLIVGPFVVLLFLILLVVWSAGVFILGAAIWWFLGAFHIRSRVAAIAVGFISVFSVTFAYQAIIAIQQARILDLPIGELWTPAMFAVLFGLVGALAALAGWSYAYRPGMAHPEAVFE